MFLRLGSEEAELAIRLRVGGGGFLCAPQLVPRRVIGSHKKISRSICDSPSGTVADAAVASLQSKASIGGEYCLSTTEGDGPGNDQSKWDSIFANANR